MTIGVKRNMTTNGEDNIVVGFRFGVVQIHLHFEGIVKRNTCGT